MARRTELRVKDISKSFPGVKALQGINIAFRSGKVHALVGENGAGKSTLVKIIAGVYQRDKGSILVDDGEVSINDPRAANSIGISIIHQEFSLFPELNVTQNMFIGIEETQLRGAFLNKKDMDRRTREVLESLGVSVATNLPVKYFSVAEQQLMEIAKCLIRDAWLIIMDEPTSALSDSEKKTLFEIIRTMKKQGLAILYISHHLEEIAEIADEVSVLRDGKLVGTYEIGEVSLQEITNLMVGKDIDLVFNRNRQTLTKPVIEVQNLSKKEKFHDISFTLYEGEVLGLCGLLGFGHADVCASLFALQPHDSGEILLHGKPVKLDDPLKAMEAGIMYVPEDRKREGLIPTMNTEENLSLMSLHWLSRLGWIDLRNQHAVAESLIDRLSIKVNTPKQGVNSLSGGNQQKVVVGKCLSRIPKVLLLNDPTRGIDVGAKEEIYRIIDRLAGEGVAIIMISSELPEYVGLCDRVLVFRHGKIIKEFGHEEFDQNTILSYMLGTIGNQQE